VAAAIFAASTLPGREPVSNNPRIFSVEADPEYPMANRYRVAQHTLDRVFAILGRAFIRLPPGTPDTPELRTAPDLFTGYLLLDALIGNTDRHHENWAVLQRPSVDSERVAVLCPSFDHASSLGHNIRDSERDKRLNTKSLNVAVHSL
jgi:hypothetical protein